MEQLKTLTLKQPWASAVATRSKNVENRTWQTGYRGLIAIHAGKGWDASATEHPMVSAWGPKKPGLPAGAIVALAQLVDIHDAAMCEDDRCDAWGEWTPALETIYHWRLEHITELPEPFEYPGGLGLRKVPTDVGAELVRLAFS